MGDTNSSTPSPYVFAPSQVFDGNDGRWSSLIVRIGTPEQNFAVLPSTTGHETFIPLPDGCTENDPANCADLRGAYPFDGKVATGFQVNASTTWNSLGLYTLDLGGRLGLDGNGLYGLEKVGLQLQNSGGLTLEGQVVAGIATKNFYLGVFGLGPKPSNFSNYDNPVPSFMRTLKDKRLIPSISYGYTAGSAYTMPQRYTSLTLGGYDASRFTASGQTFPFNEDNSIVLSLGVQKITAINTLLGTRSLLNNAIFSVIDSTLPHIWLPRQSCDSFADAFGLTFDSDTNLYLVNDTIHERLRSLNPSVTFSLGNDANPATLVSITVPYAAFDLQASDPIYPNATNYFPIRRATNESQYTLGRAFLQEAYIIADYERSNFSVHQATFKSPAPAQQIVTIHDPLENTTTSTTDNGTQSVDTKSGLGTPAIVGIAVGVGVLALILIIAAFIWYRRRKRTTPELDGQPNGDVRGHWRPPPQEMPTDQKHEMYQVPFEVHGDKTNSELRVKQSSHLLSDDSVHVVGELPAKDSHHLLSDDSSRVVGAPTGINLMHELGGHVVDPNIPRSTEAKVHTSNDARW